MSNIQSNSQITIVDDIMGSGKSTWARQYIIAHPETNFLYIAPYLQICDEIIDVVNTVSGSRRMVQPLEKGDGKIGNLRDQLELQYDIASTHVLFCMMDEKCKEHIASGNYTLILDETISPVQIYKLEHKDDLPMLKDTGCVTIEEEGKVIWQADYKDTSFNKIRNLSRADSLFCVDNVLIWQYPPDIFKLFSKVYVLTYLFDGSLMKSYFDYHQIEYTKASVEKDDLGYHLIEYREPDKNAFRNLVNVYEGRLNENFPQTKNTALSSRWFRLADRDDICKIQNNIYNYFHNIEKVPKNERLWTSRDDFRSMLKGKGYTKQYAPSNCRGRNDYRQVSTMAYCVNVYPNPEIEEFFYQRDISINREQYALPEMIQWIWRGRIRDGNPISVYIPSNRMRELLKEWLQ